MRELKRSIAKANMRGLGMTQLFRRHPGQGRRHSSKFSRYWREYMDPERRRKAGTEGQAFDFVI